MCNSTICTSTTALNKHYIISYIITVDEIFVRFSTLMYKFSQWYFYATLLESSL